MHKTLRALTTGLIDYAGLFPPTAYDMSRSVQNYARDLRSEHAFMLGRFICPVSRLGELTEHASALMPGTYATSGYMEMVGDTEPWRISALVGDDLAADLDAIDAFNAHHSAHEHGQAVIDAIELGAPTPDFIDDAMEQIPEDLYPHFEVPQEIVIDGDVRGYIAALAGESAAAKVRCGGVRPELIPSSPSLAGFIRACAVSGVPFKATAGLHHPVRAEQNLTYEDNPPRGVMHGFLNVFVGAALAKAHDLDEGAITEILEDTNAASFDFTDEACGWNDRSIELMQLTRQRESFCLGYGSCSFDEPVADLRNLKLF